MAPAPFALAVRTARAADGWRPFDVDAKRLYIRRAAAFLRAVAAEAGVAAEVSRMPGGPAVLGDVSLRARGAYVCVHGEEGFFRTATASDPYGTGPMHPNRFFALESRDDVDAIVAFLRRRAAVDLSEGGAVR